MSLLIPDAVNHGWISIEGLKAPEKAYGIPQSSVSAFVNSKGFLKKINLHFIALRFRPDLVYLIESNRKCSLSCVEDSANENRMKMA